MRDGHQKDAGELNFTARGLGNFNSVVPSEVRSRLSIHHFLSGRVWPILIFLRVAEFR